MRHKETFYPAAWAPYGRASPGSFRFLPREGRRAELERDYKNMGVMIFGDPPAFAWIIDQLRRLEEDTNK